MSIQTQKAQHPFALFWSNLFHINPDIARAETAKRTPVTLSELASMPKPTQLLLAYFLKHGIPDLTLLDDDTDVCKLLEAGWLTSVSCPTKGIICFKVRPDVWRKLWSLSPKFFSKDLLNELRFYTKRKSAQYPWLW